MQCFMSAAFLLNGAITRSVNGTKTFPWTCPTYMQSFIKIGGAVLEKNWKNCNKTMILCNFNKDMWGIKYPHCDSQWNIF